MESLGMNPDDNTRDILIQELRMTYRHVSDIRLYQFVNTARDGRVSENGRWVQSGFAWDGFRKTWTREDWKRDTEALIAEAGLS
jgi:hypothetical protein